MKFSERLAHAMKLAGYTQGSLAEAVGMAQSSIWKLVSGEAKGSRRIVDIAKVLGVRPEWLTDGSGEMYSVPQELPMKMEPDQVTYNGLFPVDIYRDGKATGDKLMVPTPVKSDSCRAYHININTGCALVPAGTYIVVDSNEIAGDGDLVYAKVNNVYSVYKYVTGGKHGYLSVDDTRVPLVEVGDGANISGVIVFLLRTMK